MRVPQVSERIKELPAQALRGVFAGIGQLLLVTDKLRNKAPAGQQVPQAGEPDRKETVAETALTQKTPEATHLDKTGNVRLVGGSEARPSGAAEATQAPVAAEAGPAQAAEAPVAAEAGPAQAAEAPVATEAPVAAEAPVATQAPVAAEAGPAQAAETDTRATGAGGPGAGDSGAPLPNYDELSIASLRARLRNLDVAQVKQMAEYERAHAGRADVIAMFERRIAKLEAGG